MDRDKQAEQFTRFPRVCFDDVQLSKTTDYLVKGLIDRGGNIVVYGPSGDGKTFFTIDLVLHAACGMPWRGKRVHASLVVYIASEAGASILRRFIAWRDQKLGDSREDRTPFVILTRGPNLLDEVQFAELMADLKTIGEEFSLSLGLVVFDTLSRSAAGGDELTADMTRIISAADRIRDELGAATLFVHHSGKDVDRGARGSNTLFAAADTVLCVANRAATVEKVRDGISGESFAFALKVFELGQDDDGDPITTCVVAPTDTAPPAAKSHRLTADETLALAALKEVSSPLPDTSVIPGGKSGSTVDEWRRIFYARLGESRDVEQSAKRQAFNRGKKGLLAKKLVGAWEVYAWIW